MGKRSLHRVAIIVGLGGFLLHACGDMPATKLTKEERIEEINWVIGKFEHNYAPLKYKEENLKNEKGEKKFNWQQKKSEYRAKAEAEISNEDLYQLIQQFVSEVEDAHTSVGYFSSMLPGKARVAYLGFVGYRYKYKDKDNKEKDALKVKKYLPTVKSNSEEFVIKLQDKILALDDMDVYSFVRKHCPRSLGQDDSNRTSFMPMATVMNSLTCKLPEAPFVKVNLLRGTDEREVSIPWIIKDYAEFLKEQNAAEGDDAEEEEEEEDEDDCKDDDKVKMAKEVFRWERRPLVWNLQQYFHYLSDASIRDALFKDNFSVHYINADMLLQPIFANDKKDDCKGKNKELGTLIPNDEFEVRIIKRDKGLVGYIRIPSFSPDGTNKEAVAAFEAAVKKLKELNIQKIVLDLVDNGGGSLAYGLDLAAILKGENPQEPAIEVRLNDNWINGYHSDSLFGANDAIREIARRRYETFKKQQAEGKWLSDKFNFSELNLKANLKKPPAATPVVLMVNENCASMCDIFTADLKDNGIAKVFGRKTMGAGGNVVMHGISPRLGLMLSQTESLVVRSNGQYVENKGVDPDKVYDVEDFDFEDGHDEFTKKACDYALE